MSFPHAFILHCTVNFHTNPCQVRWPWWDWGKPWNPSIWTCDNRDIPSKEQVYHPLNKADRSKSAWSNELKVVQQVTNHEDAKGTKSGVIIREGSISWLASTEWLKPETSKQFAKLISSQYLLPPPPSKFSHIAQWYRDCLWAPLKGISNPL